MRPIRNSDVVGLHWIRSSFSGRMYYFAEFNLFLAKIFSFLVEWITISSRAFADTYLCDFLDNSALKLKIFPRIFFAPLLY